MLTNTLSLCVFSFAHFHMAGYCSTHTHSVITHFTPFSSFQLNASCIMLSPHLLLHYHSQLLQQPVVVELGMVSAPQQVATLSIPETSDSKVEMWPCCPCLRDWLVHYTTQNNRSVPFSFLTFFCGDSYLNALADEAGSLSSFFGVDAPLRLLAALSSLPRTRFPPGPRFLRPLLLREPSMLDGPKDIGCVVFRLVRRRRRSSVPTLLEAKSCGGGWLG